MNGTTAAVVTAVTITSGSAPTEPGPPSPFDVLVPSRSSSSDSRDESTPTRPPRLTRLSGFGEPRMAYCSHSVILRHRRPVGWSSDERSRRSLEVAGWEGSAAENQEEVLGGAAEDLVAGAVGPVEVGGAELDAGEVHAEVFELAGQDVVEDVVQAVRWYDAVNA